MKFIYDKKTRCVVQKPEPEPFQLPLPSAEAMAIYETINEMMDDMLAISRWSPKCNPRR